MVRVEGQARSGRISVGDVINETFTIYGQNFGALIGGALVVFVLVGLIDGLLQSGGGWIAGVVAGIVRLVGFAIYAGFVVRLVQDVRDGRRDQTVGDLFSAAAPSILGLVVFGILFGIAVMVGFFFLIVPGLVLLTFWAVGAPAIVVENIPGVDAFGRSWRLVRGDAWSVFATLIVVLVIVVLVGFALGAIANPIGDVAIVLAAILSAVLTAPIFALTVSVMYYDLVAGESPPEPVARG